MDLVGGDLIADNLIERAYLVLHDARAYKRSGGGVSPASVSGALAGGAAAAGAQSAPTKYDDKIFRLQYNPAELEVYASALPESAQDLRKAQNGESRVRTETPLGASLELSVNLWFDKMSPMSSFMLEKNLLPASASAIGNIAGAIKGKGEESVQKEVEGFIAALRNIWTRNVTLHWADFSFSGVLNSIFAEYTMFSTSGRPVRAKAAIRIRQHANAQSVQAWRDDFEAAFGNDQSSLVRPEQNVSNLLNVGL
jgi:hypothetical protein